MLDIALPIAQGFEVSAVGGYLTFLLVFLLPGLDQIASVEDAVDGGGGSLDATPLQEDLDLILTDSGFGPLAMIGPELLDELFLLGGILVGMW